MTKRIVYLFGAFGCGKSTKVLELFGDEKFLDYQTDFMSEDDLFWFLKNPDIYTREIFYLPVFYYKLKKKLDILADNSILFVDGHPMQALMYAQTFFELESGKVLDMRQLLDITKIHWKLWEFTRPYLEDFEQTIIYINLPLDKNMELIKKRFETRQFSEELDIDYLVLLRSNIHYQVRNLGEDLYNSVVIEVNNLDEIVDLIEEK